MGNLVQGELLVILSLCITLNGNSVPLFTILLHLVQISKHLSVLILSLCMEYWYSQEFVDLSSLESEVPHYYAHLILGNIVNYFFRQLKT